MKGIMRLGVKRLRNTEINFMAFSAGNRINIPNVVTDSQGRYSIDGLGRFKGSLVPRRKQDNGEMQHALVVSAEIKTSEVDIDFIT